MQDENFLALVRALIRGLKMMLGLLEALIHERRGANGRTTATRD
jgi:hypothetical protein